MISALRLISCSTTTDQVHVKATILLGMLIIQPLTVFDVFLASECCSGLDSSLMVVFVLI